MYLSAGPGTPKVVGNFFKEPLSYVWEKNNQEKMNPRLKEDNFMLTDGERRQNSYFAYLSSGKRSWEWGRESKHHKEVSEASEGEKKIREQLASLNEFNYSGSALKVELWRVLRDAGGLERIECCSDRWEEEEGGPQKPQAGTPSRINYLTGGVWVLRREYVN